MRCCVSLIELLLRPYLAIAMLAARFVPRLVVVSALIALALPMVATSGVATLADVAISRAELMRRDTRRAHRATARHAVPAASLHADLARRRMKLRGGDLLSASVVKNRAVQIKGGAGKVTYGKVKTPPLSPRGVAYDPSSGLMAIASVDQVALYDAATNKSSAVPAIFDFANDLVFDANGGLIIADQGAETTAINPTDGKLWRYDLETEELTEIGTSRKLSNPKLLARDKNDMIHFVDGGAGVLVSPAFDVRWDVVYRLEGKGLSRVKVVWKDAGVQATAYAIAPNGWHWIVNLAELVRLKGKNFERPCLPPYPLQFATGLTIDKDGMVNGMDGANVLTKDRMVFTIDSSCIVSGKPDKKLKGARGIAHVPNE